jgi:hypothetical protein
MRKVLVLVVAACLAAACGLALASCGGSSTTSHGPNSAPMISSVQPSESTPGLETAPIPPLPAGALLQVVRPDGTAKAFTVADLKALPSTSVTIGTKAYVGPKIFDVLTSAAVSSYVELAVHGDSGRLSLLKDHVTGDTILAFTGASQVTLVAPNIEKSEWIIGADLVQVQ